MEYRCSSLCPGSCCCIFLLSELAWPEGGFRNAIMLPSALICKCGPSLRGRHKARAAT